MRRAAALILLLVLYAATSLSWLIVIPPFDAPDEIAHYDHARYIAVTGHLPDHVPATVQEGDWYVSHWPQPPLYYLLLSPIIRGIRAEAVAPLHFVAFDPADESIAGPTARRVIFQERGDRPATRALYLGRLLSWTFGAGLVVALFAALGHTGASERTRTLLIASLLLVPSFTGNLVMVNNDSLAALTAAVAVAALFRLVTRVHAPGTAAWFMSGLLIGLALLSKSTTSFLLPMAALGATMGAERSVPVVVRRVLVMGLGVLLCVGPGAIRNWLVFGDPFASTLATVLRRFNPPPPSWTFWGPTLYVEVSRALFEGFAAQFGYTSAMPRAHGVWLMYGLAAAGVLLLAAIATIGLAILGRGTPPEIRVARLAVVGLLAHLAALYGINSVVYAAAGRHMLPIVAPALALVYLGGVLIVRPLARHGRAANARLVPAGIVVGLAACWVSVFVDLAMRFRFGG